MKQYKVMAEEPTNKGYRFTQIEGKGTGRKIWIDKEEYSLDIFPGSSFIIETERDLDSENIKRNEYIKLEKFLIKPLSNELERETVYHWYILSVRGGKEEKIIEDIRQKLEEEKEMKTGVNDLRTFSDANKKKVIRGYILGYFHLTPELVRFLYSIPGVISFLNHKRSEERLPDAVSEKVIKNFFAKMQRKEIEVVSPSSNLNVGDLVRITEGALINKEGRIVQVDEKKQKVKITIEDSGWEVTDLPIKVCQKILG